MSDDAGAVGAWISVAGIIIFASILGANMLMMHTTGDMRTGMALVGVGLFLVGGFILFLLE